MAAPAAQTLSVDEQFPASFEEGVAVQQSFFEALRAAGHTVQGASAWDDRVSHIDAWAWIDGKRYGVDVKRMKRMQRAWEPQNQYTCLELHGVRPDSKGWLYGGRASLIAFEQERTFLLVWRARLINLVDLRVSNERVEYSAQAINKVYSRRGNEEITWIETGLLRHPWVLFCEIEKA